VAGAVPSSAKAAATPQNSVFSPGRAWETQEVGWVVIVSRLEVEAPMGIGPTCFFTNYTIFHFSKKTMFFRKNVSELTIVLNI
jgi:hypothetical protein